MVFPWEGGRECADLKAVVRWCVKRMPVLSTWPIRVIVFPSVMEARKEF